MKTWSEINEEKIAETERTTYQGSMPAHNKETMRSMLEREDREVLREEIEHSHSPVGDWNGARE